MTVLRCGPRDINSRTLHPFHGLTLLLLRSLVHAHLCVDRSVCLASLTLRLCVPLEKRSTKEDQLLWWPRLCRLLWLTCP